VGEVRGAGGLDGERESDLFLFKCIAGWSLHCGGYSFVKCTLSHVLILRGVRLEVIVLWL
jgi:hypothetical protein